MPILSYINKKHHDALMDQIVEVLKRGHPGECMGGHPRNQIYRLMQFEEHTSALRTVRFTPWLTESIMKLICKRTGGTMKFMAENVHPLTGEPSLFTCEIRNTRITIERDDRPENYKLWHLSAKDF
jgi:hypothetical protein